MKTDGRRVVVTGMGVKAPGADGPDALWQTLHRREGMAGPIGRFDASTLPVTFACEVAGFDPTAYVGPKDARRLDRGTQLAIGAGLDAVGAAGELGVDPARCGVLAGTGLGGFETTYRAVLATERTSIEMISPLAVPMLMPNASAANLALLLGWTGPNLCITTACAAGAHAIGEAARLVREGVVDVMLAGGTESCLTAMTVGAFWRMSVLSTRNDAPGSACRPFDRDRDGFVLGEGAGFLVLEERDHAIARGAKIVAELSGYGRNCDASHVSSPAAGGIGAAACMELAIADAGITPADIAHVNAHGTGTLVNDRCESDAIVKVFGSAPPPVTAPKAIIGHLLGAAGAVEAIATIESLRRGVAPPTANHDVTAPDIAVDVVRGEPRPLRPGAVLTNSFGFGGHNATLVFEATA